MTSIGVVYPASAPPRSLTEFAARVEQLGYDELWVVEDCFLSGGLTAAAVALAVTNLKVGVGLLPACVRNPAIAAMEIATLANMFPNRLTVAFGHGVPAWMEQIGARPAHRLAALEEVVTSVRRLLDGEAVDMLGSFVTLSGIELEMPPQVRPRMLIGTTGPKGTDLAGRVADGMLLPEGSTPGFVRARSERLRRAHPIGGGEIVVYSWLRLGEDPRSRSEILTAVSRWAEWGLYPDAIRAADVAGTVDAPGLHSANPVGVFGSDSSGFDAVNQFSKAGADRLILVALGSDYDDQYGYFARRFLPMTGARRRADETSRRS